MHLCDFLSRVPVDMGNPHDLIPISFSNSETLMSCYPHIHVQLMVTTRVGSKAAGTSLPEVHGVDKALNPSLKPEHDPNALPTTPITITSPVKARSPTVPKIINKLPFKPPVHGYADLLKKYRNRPRVSIEQLITKKIIDKSIRQLNKCKPDTTSKPGIPKS